MPRSRYGVGFWAGLIIAILAYAAFGFAVYSFNATTDPDIHSSIGNVLIASLVWFAWIIPAYFTIRNKAKREGVYIAPAKLAVYSSLSWLGMGFYYAETSVSSASTQSAAPVEGPHPSQLVWGVGYLALAIWNLYPVLSGSQSLGDARDSVITPGILTFIGFYLVVGYFSALMGRRNPLDKDTGAVSSWLVLALFIVVAVGLWYYITHVYSLS